MPRPFLFKRHCLTFSSYVLKKRMVLVFSSQPEDRTPQEITPKNLRSGQIRYKKVKCHSYIFFKCIYFSDVIFFGKINKYI